jgi:hypothetical protein
MNTKLLRQTAKWLENIIKSDIMISKGVIRIDRTIGGLAGDLSNNVAFACQTILLAITPYIPLIGLRDPAGCGLGNIRLSFRHRMVDTGLTFDETGPIPIINEVRIPSHETEVSIENKLELFEQWIREEISGLLAEFELRVLCPLNRIENTFL